MADLGKRTAVGRRVGSHREFKEEKPEEQISLQCGKAGSKT